MRVFTRLPAPAVLNEPVSKKDTTPKWIHYGNRYAANRGRRRGFEFSWPTVHRVTLNHHLLPTLRLQTVDHCAYCDGYPLGKGDESIDHFLPKQNPSYYALVCQWENLYLACSHCQKSKREQIDPLVLRPDEIDYSFERYFIYSFVDHKIEINLQASPDDQQRATVTHQFFDFDNAQLITKRRHAFERYNRSSYPVLDDYNFRFMFDF